MSQWLGTLSEGESLVPSTHTGRFTIARRDPVPSSGFLGCVHVSQWITSASQHTWPFTGVLGTISGPRVYIAILYLLSHLPASYSLIHKLLHYIMAWAGMKIT